MSAHGPSNARSTARYNFRNFITPVPPYANPDLNTMKDLHPANKRMACDRCRAHKLRCPRADDNLVSCTRCQRAGVVCTTGTTRPLGRPAANKSTQGAASRSHRMHERCTEQNRSPREKAPVFPASASDTQSMWLAGSDDFPMPDVLGSQVHQVTSDAWGSMDHLSCLFGARFPDEFILGPSEGFRDHSPTLGLTNELQPHSARTTRGDQGDMEFGTQSSLTTPSIQAAEDVESHDETPSNARLRASQTDTLITLSRLSESIAQQVSKFDLFEWQPSDMVGTCAERVNGTAGNPVAEAMKSTVDFLDILRRLVSALPASPSSSPLLASDSAISINGTSESEPTTPQINRSSVASGMQIGTPTLLLLLSDYLQLMQLYNSMLRYATRTLARMTEAHFCSFEAQVQGQSQTGPLRVAGLDFVQAKLYVKVLVQIIEHQIESVQNLMGLPAEYCLSGSPRTAAGNGIFSRFKPSFSMDLLRTALGRDGDPEEDTGRVLVDSLRQSIKLVRETIQS